METQDSHQSRKIVCVQAFSLVFILSSLFLCLTGLTLKCFCNPLTSVTDETWNNKVETNLAPVSYPSETKIKMGRSNSSQPQPQTIPTSPPLYTSPSPPPSQSRSPHRRLLTNQSYICCVFIKPTCFFKGINNMHPTLSQCHLQPQNLNGTSHLVVTASSQVPYHSLIHCAELKMVRYLLICTENFLT